MADDKFDVIVIGAGVAGSTAALLLARAGLQVVLIERGPYPGSKNLSGGVLYGHSLNQVLPSFWETAPVERRITNQVVSFLTADSHVNLDYKGHADPVEGSGAYTVLRAKFDRWLAAQAEEAGAMLVTSIKVDRVLKNGGLVTGVTAGSDEILADVVIAADGANSFIAQEAGLRGRLPTDEIALGVKELIGLPADIIQERFHLQEDEGAAYSIVGYATRGVAGGGFLYTNRDSLSVGLVMQTADLVQNRARPAEILEDFLAHPMIAPLIKGGKILEYGAHLVPEGGLALMPELFADGILLTGDAAGLGVNNGFVVRGMDLAIGSAICAAETVIAAKEARDFSAGTLKEYETRLGESPVLADMRTYRRAPHFFQNESLYNKYPEMIASLMHKIYTHNGQPKKHILKYAMESARECNLTVPELARFMLAGARAL